MAANQQASPPTGQAQQQPPPLRARNIWLPAFMSMFPEVLSRTYCVPPIHFNRLPYHTHTPGGRNALVQQLPEDVINNRGGEGGGDSGLHQPGHACLSHVEVHCLPMKNQPPAGSVPAKQNKKNNKNNKPRHQRQKGPPRPLWPPSGDTTDPVSVYSCDLRDDFAQQHVLTHLQELARQRGEVMFILSQLLFSDYLSQPSYAAAAAEFPRPQDLALRYQHGEFDLLLLHRQYGLLVGEVKSVGIIQAGFVQTPEKADADVAKRVARAVRQLERSCMVIRHLVSDIVPELELTIRRAIFLPYVSCQRLARILSRDPQLEQELCQSLGAETGEEAVRLCVCSDLLADPEHYWHVTPAVLSRLSRWWDERMSPTNTQLNDSLYLELVSRFVGPASSKTVHCVFAPPREVKTDWQAISELGWRLSRLVLTPQQIDLLQRAPPRICVTGPPGTGKTVVLVLMGLQWLLKGHDVHVLSVFYKSLAASHLVKTQLKMTLRARRTDAKTGSPSAGGGAGRVGRIFFHQYNFWDVGSDVARAVCELTAAADKPAELHVLMDEAWFGYKGLGPCYETLFSELSERVPSLHWWAADVGHINIPQQLQEEKLTIPLRYCSAVLREVEEGIALYNTVHNYTSTGLPTPAEGPQVIHLRHEGEGHEGKWPVLCFRCGQDVASVLFRLNIRPKATSQTSRCPAPLQFRDVFVLTRSSELQDDVTDDQGRVTSRACRFIQGLRGSDVPVCVLNGTLDDVAKWESDLADVAVGDSNWVAAAHLGATNGLERKVVVWLPGRMESGDQQYSDQAIEALDRLASVSRCTAQLVVVHLPAGQHPSYSSSSPFPASSSSVPFPAHSTTAGCRLS